MPQIGRVWATLGIDATTWEAGLKKAQKSLRQTSRKMHDIGASLTKNLTAPLVGLGAVAVKMSVDFNKSMANVGTLIPKNAERVNELKKAVQDMAVETGKSTADLSEGLYQVVSAFGDTADSVKLLEISAKAGRAGLASTLQSIDLISAVTKGYGDTSAKAAQKVADLAFMTVKLGQTTFPELAGAIGKVVPLAKAMGVSQEEMFAVMATATGVTGKAAEVATQLRGVLKGLAAPTKDMAELFKKFGYASGQAMVQAKGLMPTIEAILAVAKKSKMPLQKFFGDIEPQTLLLAMETLAKSYKEKLAEMQKAGGAMTEAYGEQTGGVNKLGFALEKLQQRLVVTGQRLGDALGPGLTAVMDNLDPVIARVEDLSKAFAAADPVIQKYAVGIAGAFALGGPVMLVISKFVQFIALAFGTTGSVVVAIAGVAATVPVIIWSLVQVFKDAFEAIKQLPEVMITVWRNAKAGIIEIVDAIGAYIRDKATGWTQPFKDFADKTKQILTDLKNVVVGHSIVPDMVDAVLSHWNRLASGVDVVILANDKLVKSYQKINAMAVRGGFGTPTVALPGQTPWGIGGNIPKQAPMPDILQGQSSTEALRQQIFTAQTQAYKPPTPGLDAAKNISQDVARALGDGLKQVFTSGEVDFAKLGKQIAEGLINRATNWISEQVKKLFENIFSGAGKTLAGGLTEGSGKLVEAGKGLLEFLGKGANFLLEAGKGIAGMLGGVLKGLFSGGGGPIGGIIGTVAKFLPFHKGGLITAHQGWGPDSRLIHAQVGEGIINRGAMRRLERNYGPGTFGYLNRGQLPPGAGGGAGGGGVVINNHFPNQSQVEVDRFARRLGWALRRQELGAVKIV